MTAHWQACYFARLANEMAAHGLGYVGQLPLYLNVPALAMPAALRDIGLSLGDRIAFDALKDFAVNELHRSDVYVKGEARRSEAAMRAFFEEARFGTLAPRIKRSARLPIYTVEYTEPIYDALIAAISSEAASASELVARPALAPFGAKRLADCLVNLSLGGQVVPMRRLDPPALQGRYRAVPEHNRLALRKSILEDAGPPVLASRATGMGMHLTRSEERRVGKECRSRWSAYQ